MGDAGLLGPDSITWRVNREGALLLGGGRALLLQVAHPLVAAGVAEHSDYREDPWGRLYRTLDTVTAIIFGSTAKSEEAAERLWRVHGRVNGVSREDGGPRFPAGTPYDAHEPDLLMWVHATLVDTSLLVYTRYVGRLTPAERQLYYEEQKLVGEKFGIPRERQPQTYADFNEYVAAMIDGDELHVTDTLRDVADATLRPPLPFVARPLVESLNLVTVGLLPARLREALGLPWTPRRERLLAAQRALIRGVIPLLPGLLREFPPARSAERRARAAAA